MHRTRGYLVGRLEGHPEPTLLIARELEHFADFLRLEMVHEEESLLSPTLLGEEHDRGELGVRHRSSRANGTSAFRDARRRTLESTRAALERESTLGRLMDRVSSLRLIGRAPCLRAPISRWTAPVPPLRVRRRLQRKPRPPA